MSIFPVIARREIRRHDAVRIDLPQVEACSSALLARAGAEAVITIIAIWTRSRRCGWKIVDGLTFWVNLLQVAGHDRRARGIL